MNQDRAAQVWQKIWQAFIDKTRETKNDFEGDKAAMKEIAAYGQERYCAGVEDSYEAARKAWPTALRECQADEILDAIYNLITE